MTEPFEIIWSKLAMQDLKHIRQFVGADKPQSAQKLVLRILEFIEKNLQQNPSLGRAGRVSGTRELVVPQTPFIVPYRVRNDRIEILRVYHGARRWPESL